MERFILIASVILIGTTSALKDTVDRHTRTSETAPNSEVKLVQVKSSTELASLFDDHGFNVEHVRKSNNSVPSIFLASLPKDIKTTPQNKKKELFVKTMLPLILDVNRTVMAERRHLQHLKRTLSRGIILSFNDEMWLLEMSKRYRVKSVETDELLIDKLLIKVDVIPPSLALAQASLESGWLMSAAARQKNSTFGHMATKKEVEGFQDLRANVDAYILNLNRHPAYDDLRTLRADMRKKGKKICSITLAKGLKAYSERGVAYIRDIQKMITQNDFKDFDTSMLDT